MQETTLAFFIAALACISCAESQEQRSGVRGCAGSASESAACRAQAGQQGSSNQTGMSQEEAERYEERMMRMRGSIDELSKRIEKVQQPVQLEPRQQTQRDQPQNPYAPVWAGLIEKAGGAVIDRVFSGSGSSTDTSDGSNSDSILVNLKVPTYLKKLTSSPTPTTRRNTSDACSIDTESFYVECIQNYDSVYYYATGVSVCSYFTAGYLRRDQVSPAQTRDLSASCR